MGCLFYIHEKKAYQEAKEEAILELTECIKNAETWVDEEDTVNTQHYTVYFISRLAFYTKWLNRIQKDIYPGAVWRFSRKYDRYLKHKGKLYYPVSLKEDYINPISLPNSYGIDLKLYTLNETLDFVHQLIYESQEAICLESDWITTLSKLWEQYPDGFLYFE